MIDFFRTYLLYILGSIIVFLIAYIAYVKYNENTLKTELKTQKQTISKQKKEIYLLKKNNKVDSVNTEIKSSTDNAIDMIKQLQEEEKHEELAAHRHGDNDSDILNGVFLMHPSN